jgi:hypothetical protein
MTMCSTHQRRPEAPAVPAGYSDSDVLMVKCACDGVLAYFGYPQAHDHDAERPMRAELALVEARAEARHERPFLLADPGRDRDWARGGLPSVELCTRWRS